MDDIIWLKSLLHNKKILMTLMQWKKKKMEKENSFNKSIFE